MTMYLPNDDLRPVGAELAEFDDAPPLLDVPPEPEDEQAPSP